MRRVRENEDDLKDMDDDKYFEDMMNRAYIGMAFREFFKQQLCNLKFELRTANVRMLYYASNRGRQRILEKKKYKTLGEIASLTKVKEIFDANTKQLPFRPQGSPLKDASAMTPTASEGMQSLDATKS